MRGAGRLIIILGTIATSGLALTACGSGGRQDAQEPSGTFKVAVTRATFPSRQRLAQHTALTIRVRNTGTKPVPNLAVTICNVTCRYPAPVGEGTSVAPFADYLKMQGLASHSRPVWVVDRPPGPCKYSCKNGGAGSYFTSASNTWAIGQELMPGHTATFTWGVTAVAPGAHTVAWRVSAGLYGKARAILANGSTPKGAFKVRIKQAPAQAYVTSSGKIITKP
jgi:hypothetical protein